MPGTPRHDPWGKIHTALWGTIRWETSLVQAGQQIPAESFGISGQVFAFDFQYEYVAAVFCIQEATVRVMALARHMGN